MIHGKKLLIMSLLVLSACATKSANQQLDTAVAKESQIAAREDLTKEAAEDVKNAPLSLQQKEKLNQLRIELSDQENVVWKDQLKLRAVLIKDLLSKNYNANEVEIIKGRMWQLENKRLTSIYNAIDKANKILGRRFTPEDSKMINEMFEMNLGRE